MEHGRPGGSWRATLVVLAMFGQLLSGCSEHSSEVPADSAVILDVPSSLIVFSQGDTAAVLLWQYTGSAVSGFEIERKVGVGTWTPAGSVGAAAREYTDRLPLTVGEMYTYRVRAVSNADRSEFAQSAVMSIAFERPTIVTALPFGVDAVVVSWTYADAHQTGFDVERQVGAGSWTPVGRAEAAVRRYTDSLVLAIGATYTYRVRAVISDNRSEFLASLPVTFDPYRNMVYVEGGTFFMGSDSGEADEKPAHRVTLKSFSIDTYEVTVGQYRVFCSATGRVMPWAPNSRWQDDQPIADVSWDDASAYARWVGKRLPTEAEWEYAARGGNKSKGYNYSGSNRLESVGWYNGNTLNMPRPAGQLGANEQGLYDMSGNVWEWCADWYGGGYYPVSPSNDPTGPESGTYRIIRGGSYWGSAKYCDVWFRYGIKPSATDMAVGFRCARD